ncbi:YadA-like family protein [Klebsiella sp. R390]|uniref:YadA C-terminal domain-containing protein n=1 Tax=Klebsiella sp. R390 TaxID=2755400 RepID=UPI003DA922C3
MSKKIFALTVCALLVSSVSAANASSTFGRQYIDAKNEVTTVDGPTTSDADNATLYRSNVNAAVAAQVQQQSHLLSHPVNSVPANFGQSYIDAKNEQQAHTIGEHLDAPSHIVSEPGAHLDATSHVAIEPGSHLDSSSADRKASQRAEGEARIAAERIRTNSQVSALQQAEGEAKVIANQRRTASQQANPEQSVLDVRSDLAASQAAIDANSQAVADANQNLAANRQALAESNQRVAANSKAIADQDQKISSLSKHYDDLNKTVNDNRKDASAGIAGVAAMANIPQVTQGQTFAVGAGVGNHDSESALAVGASARINDNWVVKASVSDDTQSNFTVGAGASYGW